MKELNQTPPVALLHSQLIPLLVFQIGLSAFQSNLDNLAVGNLSELTRFCDFLCGKDGSFNPSILNSYNGTEGPYQMALDAFLYAFFEAKPPLWLSNYSNPQFR